MIVPAPIKLLIPSAFAGALSAAKVRPAARTRVAFCALCDAPGVGPCEKPPISSGDGQGHREADPTALPDLVLDGQPAPGLGAGDQARGRGIQLNERGRVRAPLLRGS